MSDWGEEIPSGGGLAPGATRLRIAQPRWIQRLVAEQMSKAAGRSDAAGAKPPFEVAPFLFGVQGDFLKFDGAAAAKLSFANFDAAFDRGGLVAVDPSDRPRYARNLSELLAAGGRLLLVATEHAPAFGPPHHVDEAEVRKLLGKHFDITVLSREDRMQAEPHWKERGATSFDEITYMCVRNTRL
jgi:thiopurine S-methyltransferase